MKRELPVGSLVWLLFAAVLAIRLVVAFQTNYFTYDSYFHVRQVESIAHTGMPVFDDPLSQGGRAYFFSPVFHYIFALFTLAIPIEIIGKILPNILYALLIPLSYYIALRINENRNSALFSSLFVALFPGMWSTINSFDPLCIIIPAIFFIFYCLIRIDEKKYLTWFTASSAIAAVISPISLVIIPALWLFVLLLKIEKTEERGAVIESIIFSTFLMLLVQFLVYKKALLIHGYSIIWQNIPAVILNDFFKELTVLDVIVSVGIIAFIFGVYEVYRFSFTKKERELSAIISLAIVAAFLLWTKLVEFETGMAILGVSLAIISSKTIGSIREYLQKIKINFSFKHAGIAIIILLLITTIPASFGVVKNLMDNMPNGPEMDAMLWIRDNSADSSTIIASPEEGFLINAVALRKNVIDNNFLMITDAETRYNDVKEVYKTSFETNAVQILNKYRAKYILLSKSVTEEFGVTGLSYADLKCFKKFYENNETAIFKTWCDVK